MNKERIIRITRSIRMDEELDSKIVSIAQKTNRSFNHVVCQSLGHLLTKQQDEGKRALER